MNARHIEVARHLVEKGAEALCLLEPTSVAEALRLVETGAKLERQARGEPESRKQLTIEMILRERFEALVVHAAEQGQSQDEAPRRAHITVDVPDLDVGEEADER